MATPLPFIISSRGAFSFTLPLQKRALYEWGTSDPRKMTEVFYGFARKLYRGGTADGLTGLATGCGLASKRGTNRYRYAPTDELLRALVLANVTAPMEESAFLRHLHRRYRISIGPTEAKNEVLSYQFDETDFKKNRDRFGQHLVGMGLALSVLDLRERIIFLLAVLVGMRPGEILALRWARVDSQMIEIRGFHGRNL
jgi:integrase